MRGEVSPSGRGRSPQRRRERGASRPNREHAGAAQASRAHEREGRSDRTSRRSKGEGTASGAPAGAEGGRAPPDDSKNAPTSHHTGASRRQWLEIPLPYYFTAGRRGAEGHDANRRVYKRKHPQCMCIYKRTGGAETCLYNCKPPARDETAGAAEQTRRRTRSRRGRSGATAKAGRTRGTAERRRGKRRRPRVRRGRGVPRTKARSEHGATARKKNEGAREHQHKTRPTRKRSTTPARNTGAARSDAPRRKNNRPPAGQHNAHPRAKRPQTAPRAGDQRERRRDATPQTPAQEQQRGWSCAGGVHQRGWICGRVSNNVPVRFSSSMASFVGSISSCDIHPSSLQSCQIS